jgi:hypothetical protein
VNSHILYRIYIGTGVNLPRHYRNPDGTPDLQHIEAQVEFSLDARDIFGATFIRATGVWKGVTEPTLIVELLDTDPESDCGITFKIGGLAQRLRIVFTQESVLVVAQRVEATFI